MSSTAKSIITTMRREFKVNMTQVDVSDMYYNILDIACDFRFKDDKIEVFTTESGCGFIDRSSEDGALGRVTIHMYPNTYIIYSYNIHNHPMYVNVDRTNVNGTNDIGVAVIFENLFIGITKRSIYFCNDEVSYQHCSDIDMIGHREYIIDRLYQQLGTNVITALCNTWLKMINYNKWDGSVRDTLDLQLKGIRVDNVIFSQWLVTPDIELPEDEMEGWSIIDDTEWRLRSNDGIDISDIGPTYINEDNIHEVVKMPQVDKIIQQNTSRKVQPIDLHVRDHIVGKISQQDKMQQIASLYEKYKMDDEDEIRQLIDIKPNRSKIVIETPDDIRDMMNITPMKNITMKNITWSKDIVDRDNEDKKSMKNRSNRWDDIINRDQPDDTIPFKNKQRYNNEHQSNNRHTFNNDRQSNNKCKPNDRGRSKLRYEDDIDETNNRFITEFIECNPDVMFLRQCDINVIPREIVRGSFVGDAISSQDVDDKELMNEVQSIPHTQCKSYRLYYLDNNMNLYYTLSSIESFNKTGRRIETPLYSFWLCSSIIDFCLGIVEMGSSEVESIKRSRGLKRLYKIYPHGRTSVDILKFRGHDIIIGAMMGFNRFILKTITATMIVTFDHNEMTCKYESDKP